MCVRLVRQSFTFAEMLRFVLHSIVASCTWEHASDSWWLGCFRGGIARPPTCAGADAFQLWRGRRASWSATDCHSPSNSLNIGQITNNLVNYSKFYKEGWKASTTETETHCNFTERERKQQQHKHIVSCVRRQSRDMQHTWPHERDRDSNKHKE